MNAKLDPVLGVSLELLEEERQDERIPGMGAFDVIISYVGDLKELTESVGITKYDELLGGYAIVTLTKEQLLLLTQNPNVLYVDLPRNMYFEWKEARTELYATQISDIDLIGYPYGRNERGAGVFMAYLDSGIDYRHPEFMNENGESRIYALLDLSQNKTVEYTKDMITQALSLNRQEGNAIVPFYDTSGHGTSVAAIGSGRTGVAPDSDIIMVKLGANVQDVAQTSTLMRGVDYCVRLARQSGRPMVINLSYGNNYGAHNGSALVEQYLDEVMNYGKLAIVVGSGNEGDDTVHYEEEVSARHPVSAKLVIGEYQQGFFLQIWKRFEDELNLTILAPGGERITVLHSREVRRYRVSGNELLIWYALPTPRQRYQEIVLYFRPLSNFLTQGIWEIQVSSYEDRNAPVAMWLPVREGLAELTGFLNSSPQTTLTIPGSSRRVITVGAFNPGNNQAAGFSGRGYNWDSNEVKPNIVAPGVNIITANPGGGYTAGTGTSMATPFVSGAAALLMGWGIVQRHDLFMYGDKLKAYLLKGAAALPPYDRYPNPLVGYGRLDVTGVFDTLAGL